jgi:hypothetical protein
MKAILFSFFVFITFIVNAQGVASNSSLDLIGNWSGIDMYQDQETYDGKNYFLPNKEFIVIDDDRIKIYFYPYSKSDQFDIKVDDNTIKYKLGKKSLETDYSFKGSKRDTLIFTMHFINKTFVKMYSRVNSFNGGFEVDHATLKELDDYGFNPSAVTHLFEVDTFHKELYKGFENLDSLSFEPFQFLQFMNDRELQVNKSSSISFNRGFKKIRFTQNGREEEFKIAHSEGTQSITIIPVTMCNCDSIQIPYLTVSWADRIRKDMKENSYKYRD